MKPKRVVRYHVLSDPGVAYISMPASNAPSHIPHITHNNRAYIDIVHLPALLAHSKSTRIILKFGACRPYCFVRNYIKEDKAHDQK